MLPYIAVAGNALCLVLLLVTGNVGWLFGQMFFLGAQFAVS